MTLFDDQPSARDVRKQRQARSGEDAQHASSAAPERPCNDAATECSPSTPERWIQEADELGFISSKSESGGHSSGRYSLPWETSLKHSRAGPASSVKRPGM